MIDDNSRCDGGWKERRMKRCEDCKWFIPKPNRYWKSACWMRGWTFTPNEKCVHYERKWWHFWAPKLIITLALLLCGCSQHIVTLKDGTTYKANRFLDWTKIGSASYDDGSFTLDGYESDLTRALGIIDRLLAEKEEREKRLAFQGVKP